MTLTPKEKAQELINKFRISKAITESYAKQCALIAVDEILETTKVKWATQRKLPNGEYRLWKGVAYKKYWQEVKQEIEAL
jgi:hypothetical protein